MNQNDPIPRFPLPYTPSYDYQQILPVTITNNVQSRLRQNIKIIQTINTNRFQRSKQRKREHLDLDEKQKEGVRTASKKKVINQIMNKLDHVLNQSRNSLDNSRRCHSETKDMVKKIKVFQTVLKQVKQNNLDAQDQLKKIKREINTSNSKAQLIEERHIKKQRSIRNINYQPTQNFINHRCKYAAKKQYVYPKYLKPPTARVRITTICIEPECRTYCRCNK